MTRTSQAFGGGGRDRARVALPDGRWFPLPLADRRGGMLSATIPLQGIAALDGVPDLLRHVTTRLEEAFALPFALWTMLAPAGEPLPPGMGWDLLQLHVRGLGAGERSAAQLFVSDIRGLRLTNHTLGRPAGDLVVRTCDHAMIANPGLQWFARLTPGDERVGILEHTDATTATGQLAAIDRHVQGQLAGSLGIITRNRNVPMPPQLGFRFAVAPIGESLETAFRTARAELALRRHEETVNGGPHGAGPDQPVPAPPGSEQAREWVEDIVTSLMRASWPEQLPATVWEQLGTGTVPVNPVQSVLGLEAERVLRESGTFDHVRDALIDLLNTTRYLANQATVEPLTGGWPPPLGMRQLLQTMSALNGRPASLLSMELRRLTQLNNQCAHEPEAGNLYIRAAAEAAQALFGGLFVRISGPQAIVLVPDRDEVQVAAMLAEFVADVHRRVETAFRDAKYTDAPGYVQGTGIVAVGVATVDCNDGMATLRSSLDRLYASNVGAHDSVRANAVIPERTQRLIG